MAVNPPTAQTIRRNIAAARDERILLYGGVAAAATLLGVIEGGLRLIVIGLPFAIALALGTRRTGDVSVAISVALGAERCIEGDHIEGRIDVNADPEVGLEIIVTPTGDCCVPGDEVPWAWSIPAGTARPIAVPIRLLAERWGRESPGQVRVRVVDHGMLVDRRATLIELPVLTVLPSGQHMTDVFGIDRARVTAGSHRSRMLQSGGYDFAEIRAYVPGDRLRDLNWSATLRTDQPAVNQRLPERSGDVVIMVDTAPDALRRHSEIGRAVITRSGRLVWMLVLAHLEANDRVGVIIESARPLRLDAVTGRRAQYAIFNALVDATTSSAEVPITSMSDRSGAVPDGAAVIGVSPLARPRTIERLVALRSRGHRVGVVAVGSASDLARRAPDLDRSVSRLQALVFDERVASLRRHGIAVTVSEHDDDIAASVRSLLRSQRRAMVSR